MIIAIVIGTLIGLLSGLVVILHVVTVRKLSFNKASSYLAVVAEILAIPTFWLSGPFLSSKMLVTMPANPYVLSLGITFTAVVIVPAYVLIVSCTNELMDTKRNA